MKFLKSTKLLILIFTLSFMAVLVGFTNSSPTTLDVYLKPIIFNVDGETVSASDQAHQYYNGKEYVPESILYKGTTYVPVRFVSKLVGAEINWDSDTETVVINKGREINGEAGEFTVIPEEKLTAAEKAYIDTVKTSPGVHQIGNFVVIALGAKPNPGYGVEFVKQEMSWEQLKVYIKETKPDPNQMYSQVISYPYIVAKVELPPYTTLQIINAETGEDFVFAKELQDR